MGKKQKKVGSSFIENMSEVTNLVDQFLGAVLNLEESAVNVAKQFGQGRENIVNIKAGLVDAADSLTKVGVSVSESLGKALEIQTAYTQALGRSALLTTETFGKLQAISSVTGVGVKEVVEGFANAGISAVNSGVEMQKVVDRSRAIGVDTNEVSKMVVRNLQSTSQFNFQGGVEGMAKMAAQAVNLRIDMKSTLDMADRLFDPEDAINMAAAMQRLGVQQSALLDPLRLMDLAQNDPTELQNQLAEMSKEFVRLNEKGQFEIMPGAKRQLREIEKELKLPTGQLSKMALAGAELEDKLSKIKMPDTFTDEQKQFIANMAQMGPGGEYKLKVDGEDIGLNEAIDLFNKDNRKLTEFMEASKPKSMEELANEQLTIQKRSLNALEFIAQAGTRAGMAMGATKGADELLTGALEITSKIPKVFGEEEFSIQQLRKSMGAGSEQFMGQLAKGDIDEALQGVIDNSFEYIGNSFKSAMRRLEESVSELSNSSNMGIASIRGVVGAAGVGIEQLTGYDVGGQQILDKNKQIMDATNRSATEKGEKLEKVMTPEAQQQMTTKTELTYSGKIDLNINTPAGLSDMEWKTLQTRLLNEPEFVQRLISLVNNPQGDKSPTELNQSINSVNPTK